MTTQDHYSELYTKNYIRGNVYAITGATSGFGKEVAIEILKMGGKVIINGRRQEALNAVMEEVAALGKENDIIAVLGDVAEYDTSKRMVEAAVNTYGKLDAFLANAGIMPNATFAFHSEALPKWEKCIDINLKGNLYGICACYDQFQAQGYGHFLTVSSLHGNFPTAGAGVYAATKVAIRYMAHTLMVENPGVIKVSIIRPTGVGETQLGQTVVSRVDSDGIFGKNTNRMINNKMKLNAGEAPEYGESDSIQYISLNTEEMVWGYMFALNQPRGVNCSDITMRATNECLIL